MVSEGGQPSPKRPTTEKDENGQIITMSTDLDAQLDYENLNNRNNLSEIKDLGQGAAAAHGQLDTAGNFTKLTLYPV